MGIDFEGDATNRKYKLSCDIVIKKMSTQQGASSGASEFDAVLLVPRESSQRNLFLAAWLPDTTEEHFELLLFLKHPINSPARFSIHRMDETYSKDHYLFCMTKGVEDVLLKRPEKTIEVDVFPSSMDAQGEVIADAETDTPIELK